MYNSLKSKAQTDDSEQSFFHDIPWIKAASYFSLKYGEDILTLKKDTIEIEMKDYLEKEKLDISSADIPYMAKFI